MARDELCHLEHGDFALAIENRLQLVIREDVALVRRVLAIVLLNVFPELFDDFGARHGALADNGLKVGVESKRSR